MQHFRSKIVSKIRVAMVGGGIGGFIGEIHRMAMRLDDRYELVAGALSSDPERSIKSGHEIGLERPYGSWQELFEVEHGNLDCISIVTPNDSHAEIATAAIQSGFHVVLDKPMTRTLEEAKALAESAMNSSQMFAMTYTYTGYPMIREMKSRVISGEIGDVRNVSVTYRQGWLSDSIENDGQKQALWRTNPDLCGAGALGDIGSHAEQLSRFVTGQTIQSVRGDVHSVVAGRKVDDHASVQMKLSEGVIGDLVVSQVSAGELNNVQVKVYGDKGALTWSHSEPDVLTSLEHDGTEHRTNCSVNRAPSGHPAGFVEAFANIYRDCANVMQGGEGVIIDESEGLASMKFIDAVLRSQETQSWVEL